MKNALPWIIAVALLSVLIMTIVVNNRLSKANKTISGLNNLHQDIDNVLVNHFSKLPEHEEKQEKEPLKKDENGQ